MIHRTRNPSAPLSSGVTNTETLWSSRFDALLKNLVFQCRRVCMSRNFKLHLSTLTRSRLPVSLCFPGTFRGISALHHISHCRMLQASTSSSQNGNRIFKLEEGLSHRTQQRADRHAASRSQGSDSAQSCVFPCRCASPFTAGVTNAEHPGVHYRCTLSLLQRVLQHPMIWVAPVHLQAFPSMIILQSPNSLVQSNKTPPQKC